MFPTPPSQEELDMIQAKQEGLVNLAAFYEFRRVQKWRRTDKATWLVRELCNLRQRMNDLERQLNRS